MTMEALASNEFPSYLVYDTITANPLHGVGGGGHHHNHGPAEFFFENAGACGSRSLVGLGRTQAASSSTGMSVGIFTGQKGSGSRPASGLGAGQAGKRKRRRRPRSCKNKEEAETQRMTHIAVERNRRRQMNEHLAVLRSLMPESYIQRGDQASIVGGAIDFVKELEQLAQSLEAQKRMLQQQQKCKVNADTEQARSSSYSNSVSSSSSSSCNSDDVAIDDADSPPFAQFFAYPQYIWRQAPGRESCPSPAESHPAAPADIEVTLTETHANLRILSPKRPRQLLKMVAALQTLRLTILHLNVTALDSMVLYSFSLKVEEGCNLTSVDDIAAAVHHILSLIEAELTVLCN